MTGDGILWAVPHQELEVSTHLPNPPAHIHCTLLYAVAMKNYQNLIGKEFKALIFRQSWNHRAEALELKLPPRVPCQNTQPHITVALAPDAGAVESNDMLAGDRETLPRMQWIDMTIEFLEWGETNQIHS